MGFEAEIRNNIRSLTDATRKLEKANRDNNNTIQKMTALSMRSANAIKRSADMHERAAVRAKRHSDRTKDVNRNIREMGRASTRTRSKLGRMGNTLSKIVTLAPKLQLATAALAGMAAVMKVISTAASRAVKDIEEVTKIAAQAENKIGARAAQQVGAGLLERQAGRAFAGVDETSARFAALSGGASNLEDARKAQAFVQQNVRGDQQERVLKAGRRASRATGISLEEAVTSIAESFRDLRQDVLQTGLRSGRDVGGIRIDELAAAGAGVSSAEEFRRGEKRAFDIGVTRDLEASREATARLDEAKEGQVLRRGAGGDPAFVTELEKQTREIVEPGSRERNEQIDLLKQQIKLQEEQGRVGNLQFDRLLEFWQGAMGVFGGEGTKRQQLERLQANIRTARAVSSGQ